MNNLFNDAIEAHTNYKVSLIKYIEENIIEDINNIGDCLSCELGKWISSEGEKYRQLPFFEEMRVTHEEFHRIAAGVTSYGANKDQARSLLSASGALSQNFDKLVKSLVKCSKEINHLEVDDQSQRGKVKDLLAKKNNNVWSIDGHKSALDAVKFMIAHNVGSLAVYGNDEFLGIFTERGFFQHISYNGSIALERPVSQMIDVNTIYVDPNDSVEKCMMFMTSAHARHLPVLENGELVGILSIGDVIKQDMLEGAPVLSDSDNTSPTL